MADLEEKVDAILSYGGTKKDIIVLIISFASIIISFFYADDLPIDPSWVAIILCGVPIVIEAIFGLVKRFDIKADVLVSIALIASIAIGELFAAGEIAAIMQLGSFLEEFTVSKANASLERLVKLTPRTARLVNDGKESIVDAENVCVNDIVRILPGEIIPVDGTILKGNTSIDQSAVTGESMPVDRCPGEQVFSGTLNQYGAIDVRADKVGKDSSIQRMVELVRSADAGKAKIVRLADKVATWVVVIALLSAVITFIVTGELVRSVTILVVFCPCSLVLATPTAIIAAISNVSKHGFLVREGDALERLSSVDTITFDKTGTITYGVPKVVGVISVDAMDEERIFRLSAAVERFSEHPLGVSIASGYKAASGDTGPECVGFSLIPGEGVSGTVEGHSVFVGNSRMMSQLGLKVSEVDELYNLSYDGSSLLTYVAIDGIISGGIVLSDTIRDNAEETVAKIKGLGIRPILLTGDSKKVAEHIADEAGIDEVFSECLPEDKLTKIEECQNASSKVCMIGDGINDAPALKKADVGIAMAGIGSDIAIDAADIALISDDIREIPHIISLSKKMMTTIKINITFSMVLNFLAMGLAATGILGPVVGALIHNCGSVLVIINSALLMLKH